MVVGACQGFQFFRQSTWFLENNRALSKFLSRIFHFLISITKLWRKSVHKTHFYINHASHLKKKCTNIRFYFSIHKKKTKKNHKIPYGQLVIEKYKTTSEKVMLCSLRTYCYLSTGKKLRITYWKKQNIKNCETWHEREHHQDILRHIHNCNVWKMFEDPNFDIKACKRLQGFLVTIFFIATYFTPFIVWNIPMY